MPCSRAWRPTVRKLLRNYDLFGRYGGEEFAVLLPAPTPRKPWTSAERLRAAVEAARAGAGAQISYTISIGVATVTPDLKTSLNQMIEVERQGALPGEEEGQERRMPQQRVAFLLTKTAMGLYGALCLRGCNRRRRYVRRRKPCPARLSLHDSLAADRQGCKRIMKPQRNGRRTFL